MNESMTRLQRTSFWAGRRATHTVVATIVVAFIAAVVGIGYGAWLIFQPYPQFAVGSVSVYLVGAAVFAIAAGWWAGRRVFIIDGGYGDPGRAMVVLFAALSISSVAVWSASAAATSHVPDASARVGTTSSANQMISPLSVDDTGSAGSAKTLNAIPGADPRTCEGANALSCSNLLVQLYGEAAGFTQYVAELCRPILAQGRDAGLVNACNQHLQGSPGDPLSNMNDEMRKIGNELAVVANAVGLPPLRLK